MKSGLLWFDGSQKPFAAKIEDAVKRYKEKFGVRPDTCFINPRDALREGAPLKIDGITIRTKDTILTNHLWLGLTK